MRISSLSDGVFAIALTLLTLEVHVPHGEYALLGGQLTAYVLGFVSLSVLWLSQSRNLPEIEDKALTSLHLLLLMIISLIPFATAALSQTLGKAGIGIYTMVLAMACCVGIAYWQRAHVITGDIRHRQRRNRLIRALVAYTVAAFASLISVHLSVYLLIALQLDYAFVRMFLRDEDTSGKAETI